MSNVTTKAITVTTTRDIGLAIRDNLEGRYIPHVDDEGDVIGRGGKVDFIECSDPDNLHVTLHNGAVFVVRIVRGH